MRILHLGKFFPPTPGGMERFLGDLIAAQRHAGHEAVALVHGEQGKPAPVDDSAWLMRCPAWFSLIFAPIAPAFPVWLYRALKRWQPQLLHLHMPNPSTFWALLLPAARNIPWIVHWHSDVEPSRFRLSLRLAYPVYRIFERLVLERAEVIVVTSPPYLESSLPLAPWRYKCVVIPLGVDPQRLPDVSPEEGSYLWPADGLRLLAIGRLSYYKGFETLIHAVARTEGQQLLIVGEGEERLRLEQTLAELGNPAHIRLVGAADDATCRRLLASCDIYCLPSRERTEAFGIVLMEAMRYGKPAVASRIAGSGVTWVVRDGENGRLVEPESVSAWQQTLHELGSDAITRLEMGQRGQARFWQTLDIASTEQRLNALYARVASDVVAADPPRHGCLIVIPALNEAASLGSVLAEIKRHGSPDVVVIDDGSQDDTAAIARAQGAAVLQAPLRQGAWGAMQTGIRYALYQGYDGVITMDADGQHEPAHLPDMLSASAGMDVVIGSCPQRGSRLRHLAWAYFRCLTGFGYEDLTSGFRYYSPKACRLLAGNEATLLDYQDVGILLLLHKAGCTIRETPVQMNPRLSGVSRIFSSWWTVFRYMAETTLLCLARWNPARPK